MLDADRRTTKKFHIKDDNSLSVLRNTQNAGYFVRDSIIIELKQKVSEQLHELLMYAFQLFIRGQEFKCYLN